MVKVPIYRGKSILSMRPCIGLRMNHDKLPEAVRWFQIPVKNNLDFIDRDL